MKPSLLGGAIAVILAIAAIDLGRMSEALLSA
jgi:hypothetical protein